MFLSPRLKDPGKGSSVEPSIMWGICILEREKPSSSLLISSPRKIRNHPQGSPGLGDPARDLRVSSSGLLGST